MELDDLERMKQLDPENMIGLINRLPEQLSSAWDLGQTLPLPELGEFRQVVVVGMGGSAIGADLLASYTEPMLTIPLIVQRGYSLPAWAGGPKTLVICSSHSGNTEETLSGYRQAKQSGCTVMAVTTGGKLGELADKAGDALWQYSFDSQPRAAVGYSFGLLLAICSRLKLIPDPANELAGAIEVMKRQQKNLLPEISVPRNPAKRTAGQLIERCTTVWASGLLAPVARRWKTQINENADTHACFEQLPEADHNTLQGIVEPAKHFGGSMHIFLYAPHDEEPNRIRVKLTKETLMVHGQNTDLFKAQGKNRLENMWTALHFGDYLSYYLAISYGINPTPVDMLVNFKEKMKAAQE
jgi:glucose/mannose-6-phosphate isomerase